MNLYERYYRIGKDGKKVWGKIGAGVLFTDGKKILLLKRNTKGDHFGTWSIPGGKVERGENPVDGANRESKEECGFAGGRKFGHYDDTSGRHHFHTYFHEVEKPFDVNLSDEHSDYKWVNLNDVNKLKLHPRFAENWEYFKRKIHKHFPRIKSFSDWLDHKEKTN